jgi:hypothetical protein
MARAPKDPVRLPPPCGFATGLQELAVPPGLAQELRHRIGNRLQQRPKFAAPHRARATAAPVQHEIHEIIGLVRLSPQSTPARLRIVPTARSSPWRQFGRSPENK